MEERKTIFDYLAQVLIIFGFSMLILNLLCIVFGDSARSLPSSMFALGSRGIATETAFQYLTVSALITGLRFLFFSDRFIPKMSVPLRTVCMLGSVLLITTAFIIRFQWFPFDLWQAWIMFFVCFLLSFVCSYLVMLLKERTENRKLQEALKKLKEKERANIESVYGKKE